MVRFFRKIAVFALGLGFILAAASTTRAQEEKDVIPPITRQGSAAMIFELGGLGTFNLGGPSIGPFVSSAVGMKYFISDGMALFVLAGLNTSSGSANVPDSISAKQSSTTFGIAAGVQAHFRPLYSTSPYVGGQVSFSSTSTDNGDTGSFVHKTSSSQFGVAALAGFDWFFTHGLCLGGEMSLGFTSTSTSSTSASKTTNEQSITQIALATGASVHLDVFF
jgi:hypothetical protein